MRTTWIGLLTASLALAGCGGESTTLEDAGQTGMDSGSSPGADGGGGDPDGGPGADDGGPITADDGGIDPDDGVVRVSMVHYNTAQEVERLINALDGVL